MTHSSMRDLLNKDFASCRLKNKTSVTEKGLTVSIKPGEHEKITFFHTDCKDARHYLCMPPTECTSCDYLILYYEKVQQPKKELICFLELKGKNIEHAIEQIQNTYNYMKIYMQQNLDRKYQENVILSGAICMRSSAPTSPRYTRRLKEMFPDEIFDIKHGRRTYRDLGADLQKWYSAVEKAIPV